MIEELARVVSVGDGYAELEVQRGSSCGSCAAKASCGTSAISRFLGSRSARIRLENRLGAKVGEEVVLGLPEQALPKASFLVYIVPLLAMLGMAAIAEWLSGLYGLAGGEAITVTSGLLGLWGGIMLARWLSVERPGSRHADQFSPVMLKRAGSDVPGIGITIR